MAVNRDELRAWLVASCESQGVPVTIEDPTTVRDVVVLLTGRSGDRSAARSATRTAGS